MVADSSVDPVAKEAVISDIEPVVMGGDDSRVIEGTVADTIIDASSSMFDTEARLVDIAFEKKQQPGPEFENSPLAVEIPVEKPGDKKDVEL